MKYLRVSNRIKGILSFLYENIRNGVKIMKTMLNVTLTEKEGKELEKEKIQAILPLIPVKQFNIYGNILPNYRWIST